MPSGVYIRTEETRKKISEALSGKKSPNFGKHFSEETRKKMSEAHKGKYHSKETRKKMSGLNCHLYRDGKGCEPYGPEFTKSLKEKIRERDDGMCQWPGCNLFENGKHHDVHHIDHNRHNNKEWNLITLCSDCHTKEKFINLDEAINMFEDIFRAKKITLDI